ncbi:myosin-IIIb-like [Echinops telfairi]|uniref:Myosin-IIIb-like n=1 Tax=Echinops telfairi TaxID=9371 RepID=A0AC55DQ66_ECHTE|nr:myosin-IIIb-like [Echinops telfairi]
MGNTTPNASCQVFLKYYHVEQLNLLLREVLGRVVVLQAYTKGWLGARRYKRVREKREKGAIAIQSAWRGYDARKKFKKISNRRSESAVHSQAVPRDSVDHQSSPQVESSNGKADTSNNSSKENRHLQAQSSPNVCDVFRQQAKKHSVSGTDPVSPQTCHSAPDHQGQSPWGDPGKPGSENGPSQKQRTPRRRCQQPKMLSSPEDTMYYNQLNGTLDYQGSRRKPRKLGQIKLLDGEDEYYKFLSPVDSIPQEDSSARRFFFSSSSKGKSFAQH